MNDAQAIWLLLGWLSVIAGGVAVTYGIAVVQRSKETGAWPSTTGTVLSSRLDSHPSSPGEQGPAEPWFAPAITYSYRVAGKTYQGNQVKIVSVGSSDKGWGRAITKRYRVGRIVTVFYDPSSPGKAVLERGGNPVAYLVIFGIGVGFLALGAFLLLNGFMLKRPASRPNQSVEPTGGSRRGQTVFVSTWRLPPLAHACR